VLTDGWISPIADDIAHRALIYVAKLLADSGLVVVVDAAAPRRAWRALARTLISPFAEVQLVCPLEICADRERAVRWRPWPGPSEGGVVTAPADVVDYEPSLDPDLVLDTHRRSEWTATDDLLRLARRLRGRRGIRGE
jgi:adenylylsulfate kinase-like enzyme